MFCVYGVSMKKCSEKAHKEILKLRGDNAPKTQSDFDALVKAKTEEIFQKAKPVCLTGEFASPDSVSTFIDLANRDGSFKALKGMMKREKLDANGNAILHKKTKQPTFEWAAMPALCKG